MYLTSDYKIVNDLKPGMIIKGYNDNYLIKDIKDKNIFIQRVFNYDKSIKCTIPMFLDITRLIKINTNNKMYYINMFNKQKKCIDQVYGSTKDKTIDTLKSFIKIYNS